MCAKAVADLRCGAGGDSCSQDVGVPDEPDVAFVEGESGVGVMQAALERMPRLSAHHGRVASELSAAMHDENDRAFGLGARASRQHECCGSDGEGECAVDQ